MFRPRTVAIVGSLCSLLALEFGFRTLRGPRVEILITNQTNLDMRNLRITTDVNATQAGSIAAGASNRAQVTTYRPSTLVIEYEEEPGRTQRWEVSNFDGPELRQEGRRLVLLIGSDGLTRYTEDDSSLATRLKRFLRVNNPWPIWLGY